MKNLFLIILTFAAISFSMEKNSKIYVAGHKGLVGSTILKQLAEQGFTNIITRTREQLDLRNQEAVHQFFEKEKPEFVFLAAARVGGIKTNNLLRADFISDNLMIEMNVINSAFKAKVKKLLFLGSSCIYPRECPQPIKESYLLTGPLEPTNEPYAIAKIAGIKLCESYNRQYGTQFISCMPTNLYGPNDNFDLETSHVLPALIAKIIKAKKDGEPSVLVWGTGKPRREFLYVEDCADACIFLMNKYSDNTPVNVGTGIDFTIAELALLIKELTGYQGKLVFDSRQPDGTPQKLLDVSLLQKLGWKSKTSLNDGLKKTIAAYLSTKSIS